MSQSNDAPGARLRSTWSRLSPLPGGRWLFSRLLGGMVPYSGTTSPFVEIFDPGHARIRIRDRRRVRNHLRSIHAIALANIGELASGLAVIGGLPVGVRGILTGIEVQYLKKARGTLVAESRCDIMDVTESVEHIVEADIRDGSGDTVATIRATWRLSPARAGTV